MTNELTSDVDTPRESGETRTCPNCRAELRGTWCYSCGQSQKPVDRFFFSLVSEAFDDVFSWDSRAAKTLFALLFRPGFLTTEYFAGRRARYIPPLRLYLISSIIFFFLLSLQDLGDDNTPIVVNDATGLNIQIKDNKQSAKDESATGPVTDDSVVVGTQVPDAISGLVESPSQKDDWKDDMVFNLGRADFSWLTSEQNEALNKRLERQEDKAEKLIKDDPGMLIDALLDVAPPVMFVLLPIFALLLKFFYLGSGRYYTEHLVLAVHNHTFLYLVLTMEGLCSYATDFVPPLDYVRDALLVWIPVYMFLTLKNTYQQGYFVTFLKYCILGLSYNIIFLLAIAFAFLLGVMTL